MFTATLRSATVFQAHSLYAKMTSALQVGNLLHDQHSPIIPTEFPANMPAVVLQTEYVSSQAFYGATNNQEGNGPLTHYLYPPPPPHTLTANSTGVQAVKSTFGLASAQMVVHHSAFTACANWMSVALSYTGLKRIAFC